MAMSPEHKAAIKKGRAEAAAVKNYLHALESAGGRRTPKERLEARLARVEQAMAVETNTLKHLDLLQDRLDTEKALASYDEGPDLASIEAAFIRAAGGYGERKNISYKAWRLKGVSPSVLKEAGIRRTRG